IYFLLGFLEFYIDWHRWFEGMVFSNANYIKIKIAVFITYSGFVIGFVKTGDVFENSLVKLSALALIGLAFLLYAYEIVSLYNEFIPMDYFMGCMVILFGITQIAMGIGLLQLRKPLGTIAVITGISEVFVGILF